MPLTDAKIKALKPKDRSFKIADFDGLFLLVTPKGSKLWKFKFRFGGKENRLSFGKYPYVTLQQARQKRDEARSLLARGIDPAAERKKDKAEQLAQSEHSFANFAAKYRDKLVKEGKSEETIKKKDWLLGMANADFGNMPINDIGAQTVLATLRKREEKGHYETVGRLRSTIGAVFRYAVASGVAENDPTYALKDALIRPTVKHRAAITDKTTLKRYLQGYVYHDAREVETKFGKTSLSIFYPVDQMYYDYFERWIKLLYEVELFGPEDPLFPKTKTGHVKGKGLDKLGLSRDPYASTTKLYTVIKTAFRNVQLPEYSPHNFRRTHGALCSQFCKTADQIKAWSENYGHEDVMTTVNSYVPMSEERGREILKAMRQNR